MALVVQGVEQIAAVQADQGVAVQQQDVRFEIGQQCRYGLAVGRGDDIAVAGANQERLQQIGTRLIRLHDQDLGRFDAGFLQSRTDRRLVDCRQFRGSVGRLFIHLHLS